MSSGGGTIKYWEYHGSIAAAICHGPVSCLWEIIVDGETAWNGPLYRYDTVNYTTITLDSRRVLRFHWGTDTQVIDPLLASKGHPSYPGLCYVVLVDFFFGRERTSAPNIEVVLGRTPV
jgi:hypothetical protein